MPCALSAGSKVSRVIRLEHSRPVQHCRWPAGLKPTRRVVVACASSKSSKESAASAASDSNTESDNTSRNSLPGPEKRQAPSQKRRADSSDWVASAVTRRFGLAGGLAWVGVLTFGVLSEQIKTRIEQADEAKSTQVVSEAEEVTLPSGVKYTDLKIGGGSPVQKGYLMVVDFKAMADGVVFEDTHERGKPIVFLYGGRPFTGGLCKGVEEAMASMRAGGHRTVTVPAAQGFGDKGGQIAATLHAPNKQGVIPENATLTYDLEVIRVSIPPS
ncbi:hypothetical protein ABBQ38_012098 [Trebouxia sp. C0009 RCD-2024]